MIERQYRYYNGIYYAQEPQENGIEPEPQKDGIELKHVPGGFYFAQEPQERRPEGRTATADTDKLEIDTGLRFGEYGWVDLGRHWHDPRGVDGEDLWNWPYRWNHRRAEEPYHHMRWYLYTTHNLLPGPSLGGESFMRERSLAAYVAGCKAGRKGLPRRSDLRKIQSLLDGLLGAVLTYRRLDSLREARKARHSLLGHAKHLDRYISGIRSIEISKSLPGTSEAFDTIYVEASPVDLAIQIRPRDRKTAWMGLASGDGKRFVKRHLDDDSKVALVIALCDHGIPKAITRAAQEDDRGWFERFVYETEIFREDKEKKVRDYDYVDFDCANTSIPFYLANLAEAQHLHDIGFYNDIKNDEHIPELAPYSKFPEDDPLINQNNRDVAVALARLEEMGALKTNWSFRPKMTKELMEGALATVFVTALAEQEIDKNKKALDNRDKTSDLRSDDDIKDEIRKWSACRALLNPDVVGGLDIERCGDAARSFIELGAEGAPISDYLAAIKSDYEGPNRIRILSALRNTESNDFSYLLHRAMSETLGKEHEALPQMVEASRKATEILALFGRLLAAGKAPDAGGGSAPRSKLPKEIQALFDRLPAAGKTPDADDGSAPRSELPEDDPVPNQESTKELMEGALAELFVTALAEREIDKNKKALDGRDKTRDPRSDDDIKDEIRKWRACLALPSRQERRNCRKVARDFLELGAKGAPISDYRAAIKSAMSYMPDAIASVRWNDPGSEVAFSDFSYLFHRAMPRNFNELDWRGRFEALGKEHEAPPQERTVEALRETTEILEGALATLYISAVAKQEIIENKKKLDYRYETLDFKSEDASYGTFKGQIRQWSACRALLDPSLGIVPDIEDCGKIAKAFLELGAREPSPPNSDYWTAIRSIMGYVPNRIDSVLSDRPYGYSTYSFSHQFSRAVPWNFNYLGWRGRFQTLDTMVNGPSWKIGKIGKEHEAPSQDETVKALIEATEALTSFDRLLATEKAPRSTDSPAPPPKARSETKDGGRGSR